MKTLAWLIVGAFVIVFVLTTFIPYSPAVVTAEAYFNPLEIRNGQHFSFERRLFMWGSIALELGLLMLLGMTGIARRWADCILGWTGRSRILTALGMGLVYATLHEILQLPIGIGRFYHAKSWGMANYGLNGWLYDHFLAWGLELALGALVVTCLYALLIWFPRIWWLLAGLGASALGIALAFLAPILFAPLFNDFTPLSQTQWKDQQPRVEKLIAEAGVSVREILVMNASRQSNHTNAYFTGFGPTRQIVLYDTLLMKNNPDEIESILAHELGHWLHDHIVKGLLLGFFASLLGLFLLDRVLRWAIGRAPWRLASIADPAGLPLILLLAYLSQWAVGPVGYAITRHFERQADQVSLDLAKHPEVFIECEKKLARDNYLNVAPPPWNVWLFSTHPPTVERIRMAEEWRERHRQQ
jgi:STE24 endopeptidase